MVSVAVTGDKAVIAKLGRASERINARVAAGMKYTLMGMQATVQSKKLVGGNPLHQRTGALSRSVHWDITPENGIAVGRLYAGGETAKYAGIHEYGGTFNIPAHPRVAAWLGGRGIGRSMKVKKALRMYRGGRGRYAQAIEFQSQIVRAHTATYPERSFLRSTLAEWKDRFLDAMKQAVTSTLGVKA